MRKAVAAIIQKSMGHRKVIELLMFPKPDWKGKWLSVEKIQQMFRNSLELLQTFVFTRRGGVFSFS